MIPIDHLICLLDEILHSRLALYIAGTEVVTSEINYKGARSVELEG